MPASASVQPPVLVVHGIWDTRRRIAPLIDGLTAQGLAAVDGPSLQPNDGSEPIPALADQVRVAAEAMCAQARVDQLDLVGFSMGALASRFYVQRGGGKRRVRRFISVSGPHRGTLTAHALPALAGVRQMRRDSAMLRSLAQDSDPWGQVEVHCIYTPLDLMILPAGSSVLAGARSVHRLWVPAHRLMVHDSRVHRRAASLLLAEGRAR